MDKEKLLKIIDHYGLSAQLKYIHSEYFELDEAVIQGQGYLGLNIPHIAEELTDVMVMLKQIQYYFNIDDKEIEEIASEKIDRQIDRIESELELQKKIKGEIIL